MKLIFFNINTIFNVKNITKAVDDVILDPPAAPVINRTFPESLLTIIAGLIEDIGRFPGLMKLLGDGGKLKSLVMFGDEKSSISNMNKSYVQSFNKLDHLLCAKNIFAHKIVLVPGTENI